MQFKYPEILYALLLLIIPIIVHLFQLQRFVKVPFTNLQFLKKIALQTRKSSQLKKWLILATRMLALTCLILAFSQPYFSKHTTQQNFSTAIFLDNSFSMQAKGDQGELLKSVAQKIIENTANQNHPISLFTNSTSAKNLDAATLKNELINIQYSSKHFDLNLALLQLNKQKSTDKNTIHKNILITDFQQINNNTKPEFQLNSQFKLLQTTPINKNNVYIDSVYIGNTTFEEITLNAIVKTVEKSELNVPVSLFEEAKLIGKTMAKFNKNNTITIPFTIPNTLKFNGRISLTDANLTFDNDFYFSISKPSKINVLNIGNESDFLAKIYTENEFNYSTTPLQNLNYNSIQNQQFIVLNELEIIPNELTTILIEFLQNGGHFAIIPAKKTDINLYNQFLNLLKIGKIKSAIETERKITSINYEHQLIATVFEKKVANFNYPTTNFWFDTQFNFSSTILTLDNKKPFISAINTFNSQVYWIASPLNIEVSNFIQSPLMVPIFYNFATNSLKTNQLYYTISPNTTFDIKATIKKDEVLKISNGSSEFIPLQKIAQNKVTINLENNILESGFYTILNNNNILKTIAFNYDRKESDLNYTDINSLVNEAENVTISSSIDEIFKEINNEQEINWLFKWFLAFSALFLFIEMLILKYFKI
ncbi:hypothetical protein EC396_11745 [Lutibacter sp. HS1-25]|uniref:BatA domain-containing protein n=1 Tax=Lutibacter sp. HS1-25 TaxID=2485000 RepID=UPI0010108D39|nr:BatA domain-containing protein [Lutibacter sp. HS1-25]RXP52318.1 hypothetical protein EC396_11745 [Lutibacter sp. HS1-25]